MQTNAASRAHVRVVPCTLQVNYAYSVYISRKCVEETRKFKDIEPVQVTGFFMGVKYATQTIKHQDWHSIDNAKRQCGQVLKD